MSQRNPSKRVLRARALAGAKGGSRRTPKKAAAARANGERGGRPPGALPDHLRQLLDHAPVGKPLKRNGWAADVLLALSQARIEGEPGIDTLARELRANFSVMAKLAEHDLLYKAERALKEDQDSRTADDGPEEEDLDASARATPALRSDPA